MTIGNTTARYGAISKSFHWLTALLILTVIPLGIIANGMAHDIRNPEIASTEADIMRTALLFSMHKTIGVTIFLVALARILWAILQPKPAPLHPDRKAEVLLAEIVHWLLYGSLLLVPLTGWIHHSATTGFAPIWWPFGQSLPFVPKSEYIAETFGALHVVFERVLIVSLILHVAGALKHHFIDRDSTFLRMWPGHITAPDLPPHAASILPPLGALAVWAAALAAAAGMGVFHSHASHSHDTAALAEVASDWQVTDGQLAITVTQMGSPVTGSFADWTAAITFDDPTDPGPAGRVEVTVAIGSLTLGSVTQQAMGPDFFDADTFPTASFIAEIAKTETGYVATGPLTIRGVTMPITLPFDLILEGDTAAMTGTLPLQRLDYNIGTGLPDESSLGFGVDVSISLTATRAAGQEG